MEVKLCIISHIYLAAKETWHSLFVNFSVLNEIIDHLFFQCVKFNCGRLRCIEKVSMKARNLRVNDQTGTLPLKLKIARIKKTRKFHQKPIKYAFLFFHWLFVGILIKHT